MFGVGEDVPEEPVDIPTIDAGSVPALKLEPPDRSESIRIELNQVTYSASSNSTSCVPSQQPFRNPNQPRTNWLGEHPSLPSIKFIRRQAFSMII